MTFALSASHGFAMAWLAIALDLLLTIAADGAGSIASGAAIYAGTFAGLRFAPSTWIERGRIEGARAVGAPQRWLARHWRGERSVSRSVCLHWIVLVEANAMLSAACARTFSAPFVHAPWLYQFVKIPFYLLSAAVFAWGAVGAWRSLARYGRHGWRRVLRFTGQGVIVASTVVLLWQAAFDHVRFASARPVVEFVANLTADRGGARFDVSSDGLVVRLRGSLIMTTGNRFLRTLDDHPAVRTIELASGGGSIGPAMTIVNEVKRRGMDAHVVGRCASACTMILMAGRRRTAEADTAIGFHATTSSRSDELLRSYLRDAGLSKPFVDHVLRTPNSGLWLPDVDELLRERVLTEAPRDESDD